MRKSLRILGSENNEPQQLENGESGLSRRNFLKILGGASALTAAGCANPASQNVYPNVMGSDDQIPGIAVWYSSTCTQCSAGCGLHVRTREGRAVKVEGNPNHPVNRGGLCGLGQASLQELYDPDRVREPLQKGSDGTFKPITWDAAYELITAELKKKGKKAFVTGETTGAIDELLTDWSKALSFDHVIYDPMQPVSLAKAAELLYGTYGVPEYSFDKTEVILNFGADFLETWVSPCGFARDWAKARKAEKPLKFIHIEPRLSLTGANADMWLSAKPGTEVRLALAILKELLGKGRGDNLSDDVRRQAQALVKDVSVEEVAAEAGVPSEKILLIAHTLSEAKASLVISGGAAASTQDPLPLHVATLLINHVLENVGKTVNVGSARKPKSSVSKMNGLIESLNKGDVNVVFVHGTNPAFTLPSSYGLPFALKKASLIVSFSSHLDDTADLANLILPSNTPLESWGDSRPLPGVNSLIQPTMTPVFNTKNFGDTLLEIAKAAGAASVAGGAENFEGYLKASWKKLQQSLGVSGDSNKFWLESLERGGYFDSSLGKDRVKVKFDTGSLQKKFTAATFDAKGAKDDGLIVYAFPSVKTFDGRAANRPWLQELPDPITQVVWDSWAELHPDTAAELGIERGDFVTIRNYYGEVNVPAYPTPHVHKGIVAVPIGQGHTRYGRFAGKVGGGNVLSLLSSSVNAASESIGLLSVRALVQRGRGKATLVSRQGTDSQMGRGLARTSVVGAAAEAEHKHEEKEEEIKQMYEQREHPFYRWGLAVDLASCTGCSACVVACYAENNIPVVGKTVASQNREMSWLRIERYYDGSAEELKVSFLPMMCQHCGNAPCEPVCPVYATYHNEEGLNAMVYNRCVGTRYCSNNCSYKVRRFNWFDYEWPELLDWQLNPDVTKRTVGVMEKCTFCVQRIAEGKERAKDMGRPVKDGEIIPACVQTCPTEALAFGNLNDPTSKVSKLAKDKRAYKILDSHINTQPSVSYLEDIQVKI